MASTTLPTSLPRLPGHALAAPTGSEMRDAVMRAVGAGAAEVWERTCDVAGVEPWANALSLEQLSALAAAILAEPGVVGLTGRALAARVATYGALAEVSDLSPDAPHRTFDWARHAMESLLRNRLPDDARMEEILELDLFCDLNRSRLDQAARSAADRFGTPMALVSIVLGEAQCFAGSYGLSAWMEGISGMPIEWAFCATVVRTRAPYLVPDASIDVIQRTNPLVERDGLRCYAGVPMITSRGHVLGSFCVLGDQPRGLTESETAELRAMADAVVAELEASRRSRRARS